VPFRWLAIQNIICKSGDEDKMEGVGSASASLSGSAIAALHTAGGKLYNVCTSRQNLPRRQARSQGSKPRLPRQSAAAERDQLSGQEFP